ncbi:MAG: hypothetical protein CME64_05375 [Halobacteriovoraceae bacterium]|nr:hypothetical protein [Halobacteriovoraceae bacterium]|tara:strand:- start:266125 stop:266367 length:243 start_codon:yes stop_codon:yes gene_type:complete
MRIVLIALFLFSPTVFAKKKVIYKYKEYEKFDLGDLEIKGSIVAPGDLSVKERRRKTFERNLLQRRSFDKEMIQDIKFLR